jgi:hypothetical protein
VPQRPIDQLVLKCTHNSYSMQHSPAEQLDDYGVWGVELDFGVTFDGLGKAELSVGHDEAGDAVRWRPTAGLALRFYLDNVSRARSWRYRPILIWFDYKNWLAGSNRWVWPDLLLDQLLGEVFGEAMFDSRSLAAYRSDRGEAASPTPRELAGRVVAYLGGEVMPPIFGDRRFFYVGATPFLDIRQVFGRCPSLEDIDESIATGKALEDGDPPCIGGCRAIRIDRYQSNTSFDYSCPPNPICVDQHFHPASRVVVDCPQSFDNGGASHGTYMEPYTTFEQALARARGVTPSHPQETVTRAGEGFDVRLTPGVHACPPRLQMPVRIGLIDGASDPARLERL